MDCLFTSVSRVSSRQQIISSSGTEQQTRAARVQGDIIQLYRIVQQLMYWIIMLMNRTAKIFLIRYTPVFLLLFPILKFLSVGSDGFKGIKKSQVSSLNLNGVRIGILMPSILSLPCVYTINGIPCPNYTGK